MKLTDSTIKNAKAKDKQWQLADGKGLVLQIMPNGSKLWRYRYRYGGNASMLSLGAYPELSLSAARVARNEAAALLKSGVNPSSNRKAIKAAQNGSIANSFEVVAREWFNEHKQSWSDNHASRIIRRLERDIFPWLGKRPIADITAPEVLAVVRRIKDRGALETAHRALGNCGQAFRYGVQTGRCIRDITFDLRGALPQPEVKHMAAFTDPQDIARLLRSFDKFKGSFQVQCALRLSVLLFVRPIELRTARWDDIDFERNEWRYFVTKTKINHIVPLAAQSIAILKLLHALTGAGEYVFAVNNPKKPMSDNTVNSALRRLGWDTQTEHTGHGARSMARTVIAEELGIAPEAIEHQLAHSVPDALGTAYNRTKYLKDRTLMMQIWADYLDKLKADEKVIPMMPPD